MLLHAIVIVRLAQSLLRDSQAGAILVDASRSSGKYAQLPLAFNDAHLSSRWLVMHVECAQLDTLLDRQAKSDFRCI
jgi:hypothetical protein